MSNKTSVVRFIKGTVFSFIRGKRKNIDTLEEALDVMAQNNCKGIDVCKGVLWLIDQETNEPVQLSIKGGLPEVRNKDGVLLYTTPEPVTPPE